MSQKLLTVLSESSMLSAKMLSVDNSAETKDLRDAFLDIIEYDALENDTQTRVYIECLNLEKGFFTSKTKEDYFNAVKIFLKNIKKIFFE